MLRRITQNAGGTPDKPRFKAGDQYDYPLQTWRQIAASLNPKKDPNKVLESFSKVEVIASAG